MKITIQFTIEEAVAVRIDMQDVDVELNEKIAWDLKYYIEKISSDILQALNQLHPAQPQPEKIADQPKN